MRVKPLPLCKAPLPVCREGRSYLFSIPRLVDAAPWPPLVPYGTSVPGSDDHVQ